MGGDHQMPERRKNKSPFFSHRPHFSSFYSLFTEFYFSAGRAWHWWKREDRSQSICHLSLAQSEILFNISLSFYIYYRKPPTYKQVIQANGSAKKKHKEEKPPDLWINHTENLEMKPVDSVNPAPDVCTNTTALIPRLAQQQLLHLNWFEN